MDYAMPKAHHFPNFVIAFEEIPSTTNPLGVKGIGEAGAIGAPTAVMNAVIHALRPFGVTHVELPATPMRVWKAIQARRAPAASNQDIAFSAASRDERRCSRSFRCNG